MGPELGSRTEVGLGFLGSLVCGLFVRVFGGHLEFMCCQMNGGGVSLACFCFRSFRVFPPS